MRRNKGFSLVELIIVMACLGFVILFFWNVLNSTSEDSYTIGHKIEVQNSVTSLMNQIEKDVQEAKIFSISADAKGIIVADNFNHFYKFADTSDIEYEFDDENFFVTRTHGEESTVFNNITEFSMFPIENEKYGVEVKIVGNKEGKTYEKTRYSLSSTFYTRNTR